MAPDIYFALATEEHARQLAPRVRAEALAEIRASCGSEPLPALLRSIEVSVLAKTLMVDGVPACIYGVAPSALERVGVAWLIGSDAIVANKRAFLALCDEALAELHEIYPVLINWVDCRFESSVRWLQWLGARLAPPEPYGVERLPFRFFVLVKE